MGQDFFLQYSLFIEYKYVNSIINYVVFGFFSFKMLQVATPRMYNIEMYK